MRHPPGSPAQPRQVGKRSILTGRKVQVATWPVFPKPRASSDRHDNPDSRLQGNIAPQDPEGPD